jgi:hypothetical protein
MDRRTQKRIKKNYALSENIVVLIRLLAEKHGLSDAGVISTAVAQWADRDNVGDKKQ